MRIVAIYLSILALLYFILSVNVIRLRWKYRVGIGDQGQKHLLSAIRIHGNFAEYVPFVMFLIFFMAFIGVVDMWIHICGASLVLGRLLHMRGVSRHSGATIERQLGMSLTFFAMLVSAIKIAIWCFEISRYELDKVH